MTLAGQTSGDDNYKFDSKISPTAGYRTKSITNENFIDSEYNSKSIHLPTNTGSNVVKQEEIESSYGLTNM